jgi:hypothetical protein
VAREPHSSKLRPGTWDWAKAALREVAAEFHLCPDFYRCGAPKGGGRTVLVLALRVAGVLEPAELPEPFVDRLADRLDTDGVTFRRDAQVEVSQFDRRQLLRKLGVRLCRKDGWFRSFTLDNPVELVWAVRVTIPENLRKRRPHELVRRIG